MDNREKKLSKTEDRSMNKNRELDVSIILVGLNACHYICQCIDSIKKAKWKNYSYEVIYVDNGSKDDTVIKLKKDYPEVPLIVNDHNRGYCPAANQGAEIAIGRYYFFLNDDTIILDDAIAVLIDFMDEQPAAGIIGSRLFYPDMTEQWSGRMFPTLANAFMGRRSLLAKLFPNAKSLQKYLCKDQLNGSEPFVVDWVSAAAMLVRKESFEKVHGLAEDYYYWHEAIFSDRVLALGGKTYLHPLSKIIHFEGKGSGKRSYPAQKFHIQDFHKGAFRCYCEHYKLKLLSPLRLLIKSGLAARAGLLLLIAWLRSKIVPLTTKKAAATGKL
jgi:hypothetical protein